VYPLDFFVFADMPSPPPSCFFRLSGVQSSHRWTLFAQQGRGVGVSFPKVYWKTLEIVMNSTRRYIQRNQLGLQANLTEEQYTCVTDVLQAILSCLALLPSNTPTE